MATETEKQNEQPQDQPQQVKKTKEQVQREIRERVDKSQVDALKVLMERAEDQEWREQWSKPSLWQRNANTDKPYRGMNQVVLMARMFKEQKKDVRWLTLNQINERGLSLEKGSKSSLISFMTSTLFVDKKDEQGNVIMGQDGKPEKEAIRIAPILKQYFVFSGEDVKGLPPYIEPKYTLESLSEQQKASYEHAEQIIKGWTEDKGIQVIEGLQHQAFLQLNKIDPEKSVVRLPLREQFEELGAFYSVAFHELAHSTMISGIRTQDELNKNPDYKFGSAFYAREELVAELTSLTLCQELGIDTSKSDLNKQSFKYISDWSKNLLSDDDLAIAIRDSQKAAQMLLKYAPEFSLDKLLELEQVKDVEATVDAIVEQSIAAEETLEQTQAKVNDLFAVVDTRSTPRPTIKPIKTAEDEEETAETELDVEVDATDGVDNDETNEKTLETTSAATTPDLGDDSQARADEINQALDSFLDGLGKTDSSADNVAEQTTYLSMAHEFLAKLDRDAMASEEFDLNSVLGFDDNGLPKAMYGTTTLPNDKPRGGELGSNKQDRYGIVFSDGSAIARLNMPKKQYDYQILDTENLNISEMYLGDKAVDVETGKATLFRLEDARAESIYHAHTTLEALFDDHKEDNQFWLNEDNVAEMKGLASVAYDIAVDLSKQYDFGKAILSGLVKDAKAIKNGYDADIDMRVEQATRRKYYAEHYNDYKLDMTNPMVREFLDDGIFLDRDNGKIDYGMIREHIANQNYGHRSKELTSEEIAKRYQDRIFFMPHKDTYSIVQVMEKAHNIVSLDYTDRNGEKTHRQVVLLGVQRNEFGDGIKDKLMVLDLEKGEQRSLFINKVENIVRTADGHYFTVDKWLAEAQQLNNQFSTIVPIEAAEHLISDSVYRSMAFTQSTLAEHTFEELLKFGLANYNVKGEQIIVNNSVVNNVSGFKNGVGTARLMESPLNVKVEQIVRDVNRRDLLDYGQVVKSGKRLFPQFDSVMVFADNSVLGQAGNEYTLIDGKDFGDVLGKPLFEVAILSKLENTVAYNEKGKEVNINRPHSRIKLEMALNDDELAKYRNAIGEVMATVTPKIVARAESHPSISAEELAAANEVNLSAAEVIKQALGENEHIPFAIETYQILQDHEKKLLTPLPIHSVNVKWNYRDEKNPPLSFSDGSMLLMGEDNHLAVRYDMAMWEKENEAILDEKAILDRKAKGDPKADWDLWNMELAYAYIRYDSEQIEKATEAMKALSDQVKPPAYNDSLSLAENVAAFLKFSQSDVSIPNIRTAAKALSMADAEPVPSVETLGNVLWDSYSRELTLKVIEQHRNVLEPESIVRMNYDEGKTITRILDIAAKFAPVGESGQQNFPRDVFDQISTDYNRLVEKNYSEPNVFLFKDGSVLFEQNNQIWATNASLPMQKADHYSKEVAYIQQNSQREDVKALLEREYSASTNAILRSAANTTAQAAVEHQVTEQRVTPSNDAKAMVIFQPHTNTAFALGRDAEHTKEMLLSRFDLPQDTDLKAYAQERGLKMLPIKHLNLDNVLKQESYLAKMSNNAITHVFHSDRQLIDMVHRLPNEMSAAEMVEEMTRGGTYNPLSGKEGNYHPYGRDVQRIVDMYAEQNNIPAPKIGNVQLQDDNNVLLADYSTLTYEVGGGLRAYNNPSERAELIINARNAEVLSVLRDDFKRVTSENINNPKNGMKMR